MADRFYRQTEEAWAEEQRASATDQIPESLRVAADVLEKAHRSGAEIEVAWWWLRDRADEPHVATDPVCVLHLPPQTPEQRREFNRQRGISCGVCVVTPPGQGGA